MILFLIVAVVILFLLYDYWCHTYFNRLGIPSPTAWPVFGHIFAFGKGFIQAVKGYNQQFGKVFGIYFMRNPTLLISDPDIVKEILVSNFSNFHDRTPIIVNDSPLDKALTSLTGARWKKVRNTITPAFSAKKLKGMSTLLNDCCDNLIASLQADVDAGKNTEMKATFGNLTMDTIASSAFGMNINSQTNPNDPFVAYAKRLFETNHFKRPASLMIIFMPFLRPLFDKYNIGFIASDVKTFFVNVVEKAIALREKDPQTKRVDILQLLMDAHKDDGTEVKPEDTEEQIYREPLTKYEIVAQSVAFFMGGYETSNVSLMFLAYCLAIYPECQEKVIAEIEETCPDRSSVNYENVAKMEYFDMFVSEMFRMYSPGVITDRRCEETVTIKGLTIPKGMQIWINIFDLHYNPEYWEDPEKFIPERFSKKNKDKLIPYTYLPFGAGPRGCIAVRFALFQVKVAIIRVLQNFKFEPCEETEIPVKFGKRSTAPDNGITLKVVSRKQKPEES